MNLPAALARVLPVTGFQAVVSVGELGAVGLVRRLGK